MGVFEFNISVYSVTRRYFLQFVSPQVKSNGNAPNDTKRSPVSPDIILFHWVHKFQSELYILCCNVFSLMENEYGSHQFISSAGKKIRLIVICTSWIKGRYLLACTSSGVQKFSLDQILPHKDHPKNISDSRYTWSSFNFQCNDALNHKLLSPTTTIPFGCYLISFLFFSSITDEL